MKLKYFKHLIKKLPRYFIVLYTSKKSYVEGDRSFGTVRQDFPTYLTILEEIKKSQKDDGAIFINQFLEVSKQDYYSWFKRLE